jgi:hypothetical protein
MRPSRLVVIWALVSVAAAPQQGTVDPVVRAQMESLAQRVTARSGYRLEGAPIYGSLADDSTTSHEISITRAGEYSIALACDRDCTDFTPQVFDANGRVVSEQNTIIEEFLGFTVAAPGKYRIEVLMNSCTANPCQYGLQIFAKSPQR